MSKARTLGETTGDRAHASKMDIFAPRSHVGLCLRVLPLDANAYSYEIWDEYTRRQYLAKAPDLNPYGTSEEPKHFKDFDIFQKIRILHQLSVWTLWNPDRMREKMPEQREIEQIQWVRIQFTSLTIT